MTSIRLLMYRCIQPVITTLNETWCSQCPKMQVGTRCVLWSSGSNRCWGWYLSSVTEMLHIKLETNWWINKTHDSAKIQLFFPFQNNCMIKLTYKCRCLPLKLDWSFTNWVVSKGIHCYSTIWHASVTAWHGLTKLIYWQEISSNTCMTEIGEVMIKVAACIRKNNVWRTQTLKFSHVHLCGSTADLKVKNF